MCNNAITSIILDFLAQLRVAIVDLGCTTITTNSGDCVERVSALLRSVRISVVLLTADL